MCVCACVRACVCVCMRACVCVGVQCSATHLIGAVTVDYGVLCLCYSKERIRFLCALYVVKT